MDKIWLASYPSGVPEFINIPNDLTIVDNFEKQVTRFSDLSAFSNMGVNLTYKKLKLLSGYFAAYLQNELKLKKGDRVALMMPNLLQYPVAMFGILRAGMVVVNVNPLYKAHELSYQLKDSGAKAIVILANMTDELAKALSKTDILHVIITEIGDLLGLKGYIVDFVVRYIKKMIPQVKIPNALTFKDAIKKGKRVQLAKVVICAEDVAFLQYTGGTTGISKGAMLTHRNIVANVTQVMAWVKDSIKEGEEVVLGVLPLYHIFSLTVCSFCFLACGSRCELVTNPRDIAGLIKIFRKQKITVVIALNTLFNALCNHSSFAKLDFGHLKLTVGGGMATQKAVAAKWQEITEKPVIEGYGLTEASPVVAVNPMNSSHFNQSVGLPLPATEVSIRDNNGNELPLGTAGELWVRGPQVMKGYWNQASETEQVIDNDGWLKTGDIAKIDERGFVYIVDRKKDLVIVSGFNVFPNEVEEVLVSHPDVVEAAVIGIESEKSGEELKAFVVKKNDELTSLQLISFCRQSLTAYKVPKIIEFRDELPKSNVGKILRRALREESVFSKE